MLGCVGVGVDIVSASASSRLSRVGAEREVALENVLEFAGSMPGPGRRQQLDAPQEADAASVTLIVMSAGEKLWRCPGCSR